MIINALTTFANILIEGLGLIGNAVMLLLPTSPFTQFMNVDIPYIDTLNWILPIGTFISILTAWLTCIALYYLVQVVLRWVKIIE